MLDYRLLMRHAEKSTIRQHAKEDHSIEKATEAAINELVSTVLGDM
jgi:hypothetical protein